MSLSNNQSSYFKKFAPYIGGKDEKGNDHHLNEFQTKQHLFVIQRRDNDEAAPHAVLGDRIWAIINGDDHDIKYIGLTRDIALGEDAETKEEIDTVKRYEKFCAAQQRAQEKAKTAMNERLGIYKKKPKKAKETATAGKE